MQKKKNYNIPIAIRAIYRVNVHVTIVYASMNTCFIHVAHFHGFCEETFAYQKYHITLHEVELGIKN